MEGVEEGGVAVASTPSSGKEVAAGWPGPGSGPGPERTVMRRENV